MVDLLMKKTLIAALALSFVSVVAQAQTTAPASAPAAAGSQQSIQTSDTGWQTICRPSAKDRAKQDCSVFHETYTANDRLRIVSIEIAKAEKGRVLAVSVPTGVSLKDGVEITIDGANKQAASFTNCQNNGCIASLDLTDKNLDAIKKGKSISVAFSDAAGNKIKTDTALIGFTAAVTRAD
jgi:invasion protein IalB